MAKPHQKSCRLRDRHFLRRRQPQSAPARTRLREIPIAAQECEPAHAAVYKGEVRLQTRYRTHRPKQFGGTEL
jgi:hypothetical protein